MAEKSAPPDLHSDTRTRIQITGPGEIEALVPPGISVPIAGFLSEKTSFIEPH